MVSLRQLLGRGADVQRVAQDLGLEASARLAARFLGEKLDAERGAFAGWQVVVLEAVLERMCAYEAPDLPGVVESGALDCALGFIGGMPDESRAVLGDLLAVFEFGPLVLGVGNGNKKGKRARFTRLDAAAQDAYLASWENSGLAARRAAFRGLKSVCMMGYWTRSETWGAIGYSFEGNPGVPARYFVAKDGE